MSKKNILRIISLAMLIVEVVFVCCALANPGLGKVFYIGGIKIGADVKRLLNILYTSVMVAIFVASFFVKGNSKKQ